ncbi:hypothetical protein F4677DRAFT_447072 [Hypoxylon crocopeplum]|nr:hypothetical protein F4677DRAFT_447072 [Hypoxylon crocopeplum]
MRPRQILTSLIVPTTALALALPTSPGSPRSPSIHEASPSSSPTPRDTSPIACGLYKYASTPINPPPCWAWYAPTTSPSDYCGGSTFASVASSTSTSSSWLDSCATLRAAQQADPRDYFLADYATDRYNTLLTSGACALQVQPATPPSSDQVYVGGTDVVDILGSAISASRAKGGTAGVEGSMTCSPGTVKWRMVPV